MKDSILKKAAEAAEEAKQELTAQAVELSDDALDGVAGGIAQITQTGSPEFSIK